jgi:glutathione S-transferase
MDGFSAKERQDALARVPTVERRERWDQVTSGGFSAAELDKAYEKMRISLARCEAALHASQWLAGTGYTLADIAMVPFVDRIRNLRPDLLAAPLYPRLNGWYERMRARPAFVRAFDFTDDPRAAELKNY